MTTQLHLIRQSSQAVPWITRPAAFLVFMAGNVEFVGSLTIQSSQWNLVLRCEGVEAGRIR